MKTVYKSELKMVEYLGACKSIGIELNGIEVNNFMSFTFKIVLSDILKSGIT